MKITLVAMISTTALWAFLATDLNGQQGQNFTGNFLIAVQGPKAEPFSGHKLPGTTRTGGPPVLETLLDVSPSSSGLRVNGMASEARIWWTLRPPDSVAFSREVRSAPNSFGGAWDKAHAMIDQPAKNLVPLIRPEADNVIQQLLSNPMNIRSIEPDVAIWDPDLEQRLFKEAIHSSSRAASTAPGKGMGFQVVEPASPVWPAPSEFAWHLGGAYTNLGNARRDAEHCFNPSNAAENVLVYHLDTGYYNTADGVRPKFLDLKLSRSYVESDRMGQNELPPGYDRFEGGLLSFAGHGTATLSILAGNRVELPGFHDFLGGAPYAHIASCRVSQSVVHFWTGSMVAAISAAIEKQADLITMAAGSPPSDALLDAINHAYDEGVAMIFASSDYFQFPFVFEFPPHTTVYPARFSRALAVTGVTADGQSYSRAWHYWDWLLRFNSISSWMERGSFGPDSVMDHTMAAYSPNIAAQRGTKDGAPDELMVDFSGTSAATPQLAAAAALWSQMYRKDPRLNEPWMRAEGVYEALLMSTTKKPRQSDSDPRLGQGALDAFAALTKGPDKLPLTYRKPSTIGFNWLTVAGWILGEDPSDVREAKRAAHERMLRIEAAQLFQSSPKLRRILINGVEDEPDTKTRAAFLKAVTRDPRASAFLREHLTIASAKP